MATNKGLREILRDLSRLGARYSLLKQMVGRDVVGRYRGSLLGTFWSLLTPLVMLGVYTWVFGTVFDARGWGEESSTAQFAMLLFAGLTVFGLFSEVVNRAPGLVVANPNYVKKVIFPLEILPLVALGSAVFHAAVSVAVLIGCMLLVAGHVPTTVLVLPLALAPFLLLLAGVGWFLASLGVYLRDISQFMGSVTTALMFLSPVFYPASALPAGVRAWLFLNPLSLPIEHTRDVLIWGKLPDFAALGTYTIVAILAAGAGYAWFQKTRGGFADVL
jgi:lipopolysaccharide transport system permease protein